MEKVKSINVKPRLRLIRGGRPSRFAMGSVDIVVAPENKPPFRTDAVAYEEDTFLVLSAPAELNEPPEPLIRLLTKLREMKPEKPGSVLVKAPSPLQLLAIVHDLNQEPSWKEEWVAKALEGIFRETEQRKLHPHLLSRFSEPVMAPWAESVFWSCCALSLRKLLPTP